MSAEQTTDVATLTDAEREALWTVWESDVADDAEFAGLFFATVALIAHARVVAAYAAGMDAAHEGVEAMPTWRIKRPGDPTKEPVCDDFVLRSDLRALRRSDHD